MFTFFEFRNTDVTISFSDKKWNSRRNPQCTSIREINPDHLGADPDLRYSSFSFCDSSFPVYTFSMGKRKYHSTGNILFTSGTGHVRVNGRSINFVEGKKVKRERYLDRKHEIDKRSFNSPAILIKKNPDPNKLRRTVDGKFLTDGYLTYWLEDGYLKFGTIYDWEEGIRCTDIDLKWGYSYETATKKVEGLKLSNIVGSFFFVKGNLDFEDKDGYFGITERVRIPLGGIETFYR